MIGTTLGPYRVEEKIGEGGMGEVYRARDTKLDRDVALKVLPEAFTEDPDRLARFEREAKVLASLNHPNIGHIYGLEEAEPVDPSARAGGTAEMPAVRALVLELVEGPTLADRIAQGAIPVEDALPIAKQIAEALEAAHEAGVIHRDLKPANIKLKPDGTVKVLDFGLAKSMPAVLRPDHVPDTTMTAEATEQGVVLGTVGYMSPEQTRGQPVDRRSDIWAFGCLLFEILSGRRPFAGGTRSDVMAAVLSGQPPWDELPRDVTPQVERLLHRCLEKDVRRRWRDIGDARIDLEDAAAGDAVTRTAPRPSTGSWDWRRWVAVLAAVLLAGTLYRSRDGSGTTSEAVARLTLAASPAVSLSPSRAFGRLAITRDGTRLAYVGHDQDRQSSLYLRDLADPEGRRVSGSEGARWPFFSPDGEWVAFYADGSLKKASVRGGPAIPLAPAPSPRGGGGMTTSSSMRRSPETGSIRYRRRAVCQSASRSSTPDWAKRRTGVLG